MRQHMVIRRRLPRQRGEPFFPCFELTNAETLNFFKFDEHFPHEIVVFGVWVCATACFYGR